MQSYTVRRFGVTLVDVYTTFFWKLFFFTFSYIVLDGASTGIKIKVIGWKLAKMWSFVYPCQKFTLVYEPIHECSMSWTTLNQDIHSCICDIHECCSRKFDLARGFVIIKYSLQPCMYLLNICSTFISLHFAIHRWSKITHAISKRWSLTRNYSWAYFSKGAAKFTLNKMRLVWNEGKTIKSSLNFLDNTRTLS